MLSPGQSLGTTPRAFNLEKKHFLREVPVEEETAEWVSNKICIAYGAELPIIRVLNRQPKRVQGHYDLIKNKIVLYKPIGNSVCTLVHELAHHLNYRIDRNYGHNNSFKYFHERLLLRLTSTDIFWSTPHEMRLDIYERNRLARLELTHPRIVAGFRNDNEPNWQTLSKIKRFFDDNGLYSKELG